MHIEKVRQILCLISGSCAFSFNLVLALIILAVKCDYIGKYKWLLFVYAFSAMCTGFCQIIAAPHMFMNYNSFILYDGLQLLPTFISDYVLFMYTSCFFQNLMILTLCFVFRYYTVCDSDNIGHFLNNWLKIASFSIGILALLLTSLVYVLHRRPLFEELENEEFMNSTGLDLTKIGYLSGIVYVKTGLNMEMVIVMPSMVLFTVIDGAIMVGLACKIGNTLRHITSMSEMVVRLQKKVFNLLLYQLFLPLLFDVLPPPLAILSLYFRIDTYHFLQILCCFYSAAPVVDPLMTFYMIKPYRIVLLEKIHLFRTMDMMKVFSSTVVPFSE